MITITGLNIYPIKSCAGIALQQGRLTATGFAHDREWLVVRDGGRFVTQREKPAMALIRTAIDAVALTLTAPGLEPLVVPHAVPLAERGPSVMVACWKDQCAAHDAGELAAEWLSTWLGSEHRLVRFDPIHRRASNVAWTEGREVLNRFSDAFPWLIISEASLADLNTRLERPLPMNRFRPNIVISGVAPYDEDRFDELRRGDICFRGVKNCTRCAITTTDQATGLREGDEPLRTLRGYRFDSELKGVVFGQNLIALAGIGSEIAVGDTWTARMRP